MTSPTAFGNTGHGISKAVVGRLSRLLADQADSEVPHRSSGLRVAVAFAAPQSAAEKPLRSPVLPRIGKKIRETVTDGHNARRRRGVSVISKGVCGTWPGTDPVAALLRKEGRGARRR